MAGFLLRLWSIPWPAGVRALLRRLSAVPWLQFLIFPKFLVGVVGLIEDDQGQILLLRHTYRGRHPWGLPSGWMERGEQPAEALKREILEETGLRVQLNPVSAVLSDSRVPAVSIVFRGRYAGGTFVPSAEVSSAQFFRPGRLPDILPAQRLLIEAESKEEVRN